MFTGIIQAVAKIVDIKKRTNFCTYFVRFPNFLLSNLSIGSSVSNNGCCLTITNIKDDLVSFDIVQETLQSTNLSILKIGDEINLERSISLYQEIGGHVMSGHIDGMAKLVKIINIAHYKQIWLTMLNKKLEKYIFQKGSIGIDGVSLTVSDIKKNKFCVNLIPETLKRTTLGEKKIKSYLNIEIDTQTKVIVDTINQSIYKIYNFNKKN